MKHNKVILVGAWSMIIFAVLFVGVTIAIDNLVTHRPILFDLRALDLYEVVAGTSTIQALLSIYSMLPLLLIPAAAATYYAAFAQKHEANMRIAMYFAIAGSIALTLSLMALPSITWRLISAIPLVAVEQKPVIIAVLQGLHSYLGNYVGEGLGMGCIFLWLAITSIVMLKSAKFPRSIMVAECILAGIMALILALHYTGIIPAIALSLHVNGILALWTFLCGMALLSERDKK